MTIVILLIFIIVFLTLNIFLIKELFKKFGFWKYFQNQYKNQISWMYDGKKKPGMYTIEIKGKIPFQAVIGFNLSLGPIRNIGYDIFGYMESNDDGILYFSTYLGKGGVEFIFLIENIDSKELSIRCIENNSGIIAKYTFHPHWWQKIGVF